MKFAAPGHILEKMTDLPIAEILGVAERFGVTKVTLFGSRARGDSRPESDVDLLMDVPPRTSLFDLLQMEEELESLLGVSVQVLTPGGLDSEFQRTIQEEGRVLSVA